MRTRNAQPLANLSREVWAGKGKHARFVPVGSPRKRRRNYGVVWSRSCYSMEARAGPQAKSRRQRRRGCPRRPRQLRKRRAAVEVASWVMRLDARAVHTWVSRNGPLLFAPMELINTKQAFPRSIPERRLRLT